MEKLPFTYKIEDGSGRSFDSDQELVGDDLDDVIHQLFPDIAQNKRPTTAEFADLNEPTEEEWALRAKLKEEKSSIDVAKGIWNAIPDAIDYFSSTIKGGLKEGFTISPETGGQFRRMKSLGEGAVRSAFDLYDLGEAVVGWAGDQNPYLSEGERLERTRQRYIQDQKDQERRLKPFLFEQTLPTLTELSSIVNPVTAPIGSSLPGALMKQVGKAVTVGPKVKKALDVSAAIVDFPPELIKKTGRGLARVGARTLESAVEVTLKGKPVKIAGRGMKPIKVFQKVGEKAEGVATAWTGGMYRAFTQTLKDPRYRKHSTRLGEWTEKQSEQFANVMRIMSNPSNQARFLDDVMKHPNVPKSLKKSISIGGGLGEDAIQLALDVAGEAVPTSITQGILAGILSDDPDAIASGIVGGALFGSVIGGAKRLQPRTEGIHRLPREMQEQMTAMRLKLRHTKAQGDLRTKLSKGDQSTLNMLAGSMSNMRIQLLEPKMYGLHHKKQTGKDAGDSPFFELNGTIWVNSSHKNITPRLVNSFTDRVSEGYLHDRPLLADDIARDFQSDTGVTLTSRHGNDITVGGDLGQIIEAFNKKQPTADYRITTTEQATKKYLEYHSERLFTENNAGLLEGVKGKQATTEALRDVAHISLGKLGLVDRVTGLPLNKDIPKPAEGLSKNGDIVRAVSNLESLNKSAESIRTKRAKDADAFAETVHKEREAKRQAEHDEAHAEANKIGKEVDEVVEKADKWQGEQTVKASEDYIKAEEAKIEVKRLQDEAVDKSIVDTYVKETKKVLKTLERQTKAGDKANKKTAKETDKLAETISDDMRRIDAEVGVDKVVTKDGIPVKVNGKQVPSKQRDAFISKKIEINQAMEGNHGEANTVRISTDDAGNRKVFEGQKLGKVKNVLTGKPLKTAKIAEDSMVNGYNVRVSGSSIESTRFKLRDKIFADGQTRPDPKNPGKNKQERIYTSKPIAGEYALMVNSAGLDIPRAFTRYPVKGFDVGALRLRDISPTKRNADLAEVRELIKQGEQFGNILKDENLAKTNKVIKAHQDDMVRRDSDKSETDTRPFVLKSLDVFNIADITTIGSGVAPKPTGRSFREVPKGVPSPKGKGGLPPAPEGLKSK